MKVLFVTENLPYPLDRGGHIRSFYILRELARHFEVTLLTCAGDNKNAPGLEFYRSFCRKLICLPKAGHPLFKKAYYLAGGACGPIPYPVNKNFSHPLLAALQKELSEDEYRFLHCDHLDTAQYINHLSVPPLTIFDSHNLLYLLMKRLGEHEATGLKKIYLEKTWRKMRRYEARVCPAFDLCLVCSETEKEHLARLAPRANVAVIPNGVNMDYYQIEENPPQAPVLLFIGRLDYAPNSQGVLFFYNRVWPLLKKELPQISWRIIGGNPPPALRELSRDEAVSLVERADDMRPYLAGSTLAVVPLHIGGGTRLKILEAMAAGVPVVSTAVGAEGLGAVNARDIVIADEPGEMARQIVSLCREEERRREIVRQAKKFVSSFDWSIIGKKLLSCYNRLIEKDLKGVLKN